ncbi:MAG: CPBP family glutamic-type intramembrane protease [bacterium]
MNFIRTIFWNSDEQRIKAFWRLGLQFGLMFIVLMAATIISLPVDDYYIRKLVRELLTVVFVIGLIWMFAQLPDRRKFTDFGFHFDKNWVCDFGFGFLLGFLLFVFVFLYELSAGLVEVQGFFYHDEHFSFPIHFAISFFVYCSIGIVEESFSRGYQLKNILEGLSFPQINPKITVVISVIVVSFVFGFLHGWNPNASLISSVNISFIAVLFGYAYLIRGSLALPIGLHISWNFSQGNIFGYPVSGVGTDVSIIKTKVTGAEVWTGGDFGPEAGLIIIVAILIGLGLTWLYHKKRYGTANINYSLLFYSKEKSSLL